MVFIHIIVKFSIDRSDKILTYRKCIRNLYLTPRKLIFLSKYLTIHNFQKPRKMNLKFGRKITYATYSIYFHLEVKRTKNMATNVKIEQCYPT